jgi:hypothetical protein
MYKSICVLVLTWRVYGDLVGRTGNTADLCLRDARLPIVLTVSYAFPKAILVSPDVAGPPYITSRLFPFRPFPFLSALVKHEVNCFVSLCGVKQILQQQHSYSET